MLLKSLEIKNFRGFKHLQVEKLGHVNLIVGQNNVGKSSVLEALEIYAQHGDPNAFFNISKRRNELLEDILSPQLDTYVDFNNFFFRQNKESEGRHSIAIGEMESDAKLVISHAKALYDKVEGTTKLIDLAAPNHTTDSRKTIQDILHVKKKHEENFIDPSPNSHRYGFGWENIQNIKLSSIPTGVGNMRHLASLWDYITLTPHDQNIISALNIIEPKITKIAFVQGNYANHSRTPIASIQGWPKPIPLTSMGDGILRTLQIVLNAINSENGILLIDEFENGLHHSTQKKIWALVFTLAKELKIQVFATSHSLDCLKAFSAVAKERTDLDGVAFRLGRSAMRSNKGDIIATVMNEEGLSHLLAMELEVR